MLFLAYKKIRCVSAKTGANYLKRKFRKKAVLFLLIQKLYFNSIVLTDEISYFASINCRKTKGKMPPAL